MYVLLVANVIFYLAAGFDQFLVLLLATAVSYVVACKMGKLHEKLEKQKQEEGLDRKQIKRMKANNKKQRKRILIWGLVLNIGILVVFKYTNFLLKTGYSILDLFGIGHGDDLFKLIMPLGISFFTFQILSYLIDVYKGKVKAQKNFLKYLLYISFFPQLIAGPIVKYHDIAYGMGICKEADPCRTSRYVCRSDLWKLYAVHRYALFLCGDGSFFHPDLR